MLGWLWQQVHILGDMPHTSEWHPFRDWLKPIIEGYCACFGRRGALDRIHIGHDYLVFGRRRFGSESGSYQTSQWRRSGS